MHVFSRLSHCIHNIRPRPSCNVNQDSYNRSVSLLTSGTYCFTFLRTCQSDSMRYWCCHVCEFWVQFVFKSLFQRRLNESDTWVFFLWRCTTELQHASQIFGHFADVIHGKWFLKSVSLPASQLLFPQTLPSRQPNLTTQGVRVLGAICKRERSQLCFSLIQVSALL